MRVTEEVPGEPWSWDGWGYEINFATQMRERREAKGWSQTEMARRLAEEGLKFHQTTVQRVEIGQRPLKLTEAMVIANVLGVKFERMLRGDSIEIAYNELADKVKVGAFDFHVHQAEMIERNTKRDEEMTQELLISYQQAVAAIPGAQVDANFVAVAEEFIRLNAALQEDTHSLALLLRATKKKFDGLDRTYAAEYDPDA